MKWLNHPLSGQHFYLKSAVFLTGLAIGLDSSLRQLLIQLVLILTILIFEPKLYLSLLNALKKLLPFFAGYWVFATLFGQFADNNVMHINILRSANLHIFNRDH